MVLPRSIAFVLLVISVSIYPLSLSAETAAACRPGFVWRNAFSGDAACVTPEMRQRVANDNAEASGHRAPDGGPFGPGTCTNSFVWRLASPSDLVCVTPAMRDQTARDNAASASRTIGNVPLMTGTYQLSDWSSWVASGGVRYRYRWGWDSQNPAYSEHIDAMFQIRNLVAKTWKGNARATDCRTGMLGFSQDITLGAHQTRETRFSTDNCGTLAKPYFRGAVVTSSTY